MIPARSSRSGAIHGREVARYRPASRLPRKNDAPLSDQTSANHPGARPNLSS